METLFSIGLYIYVLIGSLTSVYSIGALYINKSIIKNRDVVLAVIFLPVFLPMLIVGIIIYLISLLTKSLDNRKFIKV